MTKTVAIIGVGHGHANLYVPALLANRQARVVGVSEPDEGLRELRASQLGGVPSYADYRHLFDRHPDIDVVYVLGEHRHMAAAAIETASRGLPFVLEKPGGLTLSEVLTVRAAVAAAGVPVAIPFVQRQGPLKTLFEHAGHARHVSLQFLAGSSRRYVDSGNAWLLDRRRAGGGVMLNLGVHFIDAFLHFCAGGVPVNVRSGSLRTVEAGLDVDDHLSAVLESADGCVGFVEASYTYPSLNSRYVAFTVGGDRAFAVMGTDGAGHVRTADGVKPLELDADSNRYYAPFVDSVFSTLHDGFAGLPTLDDLVRVREVTDHIAAINQSQEALPDGAK